MIELAERHRLAGRGRAALLAVLAHELEHAGDAAGLALRRDEASCRRRSAPLSTRAIDILPPCAVLQGLHHIGDAARCRP